MKKFLLAGMIAFAAPAYAADTLPDAIMGYWSMGDEEGISEESKDY